MGLSLFLIVILTFTLGSIMRSVYEDGPTSRSLYTGMVLFITWLCVLIPFAFKLGNVCQ